MVRGLITSRSLQMKCANHLCASGQDPPSLPTLKRCKQTESPSLQCFQQTDLPHSVAVIKRAFAPCNAVNKHAHIVTPPKKSVVNNPPPPAPIQYCQQTGPPANVFSKWYPPFPPIWGQQPAPLQCCQRSPTHSISVKKMRSPANPNLLSTALPPPPLVHSDIVNRSNPPPPMLSTHGNPPPPNSFCLYAPHPTLQCCQQTGPLTPQCCQQQNSSLSPMLSTNRTPHVPCNFVYNHPHLPPISSTKGRPFSAVLNKKNHPLQYLPTNRPPHTPPALFTNAPPPLCSAGADIKQNLSFPNEKVQSKTIFKPDFCVNRCQLHCVHFRVGLNGTP